MTTAATDTTAFALMFKTTLKELVDDLKSLLIDHESLSQTEQLLATVKPAKRLVQLFRKGVLFRDIDLSVLQSSPQGNKYLDILRLVAPERCPPRAQNLQNLIPQGPGNINDVLESITDTLGLAQGSNVRKLTLDVVKSLGQNPLEALTQPNQLQSVIENITAKVQEKTSSGEFDMEQIEKEAKNVMQTMTARPEVQSVLTNPSVLSAIANASGDPSAAIVSALNQLTQQR